MTKHIDLEKIDLLCMVYQLQEMEVSWDLLERMESVKQPLYKY